MAKKRRLTEAFIRNIREPGRYPDDRYGLALLAEKGARGGLNFRWEQRVYIRGAGADGKSKRKELGLGKYPLIGTADARQEAEKNAALAAKGVNPREQVKVIPNFLTVTMVCIEDDSQNWTVATTKMMTRQFNLHVFPHIGDKPVDMIWYTDLAFLNDLYESVPTTAMRLTAYIRRIFSYCIAIKEYIKFNPINDDFKTLPQPTHKTKHYPALHYKKVPELIRAIEQYTTIDIATRSCLQTISLSGVRPHSAWLAEWSEIRWKQILDESDWDDDDWPYVDWDNSDDPAMTWVWFIPGDHMKKREPFKVPISDQLIEILKKMRSVRGQGKRDPKQIFASPRGGHITREALKYLLHKFDYPSDTPGKRPTLHGLRSTFRGWARRRKALHDVAEASLAHDTGTDTEITYMRWDLLQPRARLMQAYADYAFGKLPEDWIWIEPEVQAMIDAEKQRADEAERRAAKAERGMEEMQTSISELTAMVKATIGEKVSRELGTTAVLTDAPLTASEMEELTYLRSLNLGQPRLAF